MYAFLNFNPHLPCGRWRLLYRYSFLLRNFNPHLPCGRWQKTLSDNDLSDYFNPHLPCGRWRCHSFLFHALRNFNPHLPCGRWPRSLAHHIPSQHFNPHLPCRRWRCLVAVDMIVKVFQSTPSLQKVTQGKRNKTAIAKFQSTPSLQKVTATYFACIKRLSISIHTFLAEGDLGYRICFDSLFYFNPHLPCGRWPDSLLFSRQFCNFNPHLPYGRWRHSSIVTWQAYTFQSTPSLQKVTTTAVNDVYDFFISIHTFLAEGDNKLAVARYTLAVFQSTPSSRKVTPLFFLYHRWLEISIHTFLAEGDPW